MQRLVRALANEFHRVDSMATVEHFEVQVRPRGPAAVAHQGHSLAFSNLLADRDQVFRVVRVARRVAITMVDLDELAEAVS